MPRNRLTLATAALQLGLLTAGAALAIELAPHIADAQTIAAAPRATLPTPNMVAPPVMPAPSSHFDSSRCMGMPQRLNASWAPSTANPDREDLSAAPVSACPHFLSTMSLVRPHHRWHG